MWHVNEKKNFKKKGKPSPSSPAIVSADATTYLRRPPYIFFLINKIYSSGWIKILQPILHGSVLFSHPKPFNPVNQYLSNLII